MNGSRKGGKLHTIAGDMDLSDIRREYHLQGLHHKDLCASPFEQFANWLQAATKTPLGDLTAMILATVSPGGAPLQRTVLLKEFDEQGFVFHTDRASTKGLHIANNPRVCLLFPWYPLDRQVVVSGQAEAISEAKSKTYFHSRPRDSQIAASASQQSSPIPNRQVLLDRCRQLHEKLQGQEIPLPPTWGGYLVRPDRFEFWQGRANRLHDRFEYCVDEHQLWHIQRLSP